MGAPDLLIDPADFRSMRLQVAMTNSTTKTAFRDGKKFYHGEETEANPELLAVQLVEFLENGFVIEVPPNSGAAGHLLVVEVQTVDAPEKDAFFEATMRVEEVEKLANSRQRFTIEFVEYDKASLENLLNVYNSRQNEIENFFDAVKGR